MFLRKLFSSENKLAWVVIDLMIVIIGVYSAYLIQNYGENQKTEQDRDELLTALKYELEFYRVYLPGMADFSSNQVEKWMEKWENESYVDYSDWIFIKPQYAYQVIEYSIGIEERGIVDFSLHNMVKTLYQDLKRLENTESKIMEVSMQYRSISDKIPRSALIERHADNLKNFQRFLRFFSTRAENQALVAEKATDALQLVNEQLGPDLQMEIERNLILENIGDYDSFERALRLVKSAFPHFSEEEVKTLFDQSRSE